MAILNTPFTGRLIDAAFLAPPAPAAHQAARFTADHEKAMARRLQQLQSALGEQSDAAPAPAGTTASDRHREIKAGNTTGRTLLACLLSAGLGAGAMWLAVNGSTAPSSPQLPTAAVSIPPTVIAAPSPPVSMAPATALAAVVPDETQIAQSVETWRQSWESHDVARYLAAYSLAFKPADGGSREAWVAARTRKLATKAAIDVQLHNLAFERIDQDHFKVDFRQDYASGGYREAGRAKTLHVAREEGQWRIVRELQE